MENEHNEQKFPPRVFHSKPGGNDVFEFHEPSNFVRDSYPRATEYISVAERDAELAEMRERLVDCEHERDRNSESLRLATKSEQELAHKINAAYAERAELMGRLEKVRVFLCEVDDAGYGMKFPLGILEGITAGLRGK